MEMFFANFGMMKAKDISIFSLSDWVADAEKFAVVPLKEADAAVRERRARPHRNDFYAIYWITRGEAQVTIDMVTYTAQAGSLLFIAPAQVARVTETIPCEGWCIGFDETFYCLRDASRNKGIDTMLFFNPDFSTLLDMDPAEEGSLGNIVSMMEEECRGRGEQFSNAFYALLQIFLIRVSRIMEKEETESRELAGQNSGPFLRFRQLIGEHYKEKKNVSEYARMLQITPVCLNALSKAMSGITAGEQIRNHIIIEAKRLLHNTSLNTKEIAYRLGFEDAPYFSRFFKKYTGQTLLEFREQSRLNAV
jgi:AraC family transcriptional activator of pobA